MSPSAGLVQFIEAAKLKGASDESLVHLLKENGWAEKDVYRALQSHYEALTGLRVPPRGAGAVAARDAFYYLLSFATLGTWSIALASITFTFIELWFPDFVTGGYNYTSAAYDVSVQMACMIVAFPIYAWMLRLLAGELETHPEKRSSGVRKWLSYLALFVAAGCVIGDLITFLDYFIRGALTAQFVLKVITVGIIAGGIFWFYLASLREESPDPAG